MQYQTTATLIEDKDLPKTKFLTEYVFRLLLSEQLCGRDPHIRQHDVKRFFKGANILHALRQPCWMRWNRDSHMPWVCLYVCSLRLCFDSRKSPNLDDLWVGSLYWRWLPLISFLIIPAHVARDLVNDNVTSIISEYHWQDTRWL